MDIADIDKLVNEALSRNRGPGYRVAVTDAAADLSHINVAVTFIAGRTYCCAEPFCHVPHDLSKFFRFAAERGVIFPAHAEVRWHFVVEDGAMFSVYKDLGLPLASKHREYDAVSTATPAG
jgi:hypothetical protein